MTYQIDVETLPGAEHLSGERFLMQVQHSIQRLLNAKGIRNRDLSKRLGVSEARVSQMFGDDGANLTLKTIAKIFQQLDETPILVTEKEWNTVSSLRDTPGDGSVGARWHYHSADIDAFHVLDATLIDDDHSLPTDRDDRHRDWIEAESLSRRAVAGRR